MNNTNIDFGILDDIEYITAFSFLAGLLLCCYIIATKSINNSQRSEVEMV
jgi:hypothetical protein